MTGDFSERPRAGAAAAVVALATKAATAYQRQDLAERLDLTTARLASPDLAVMVVGEFKQGKSMLVNALLNIETCAVDDDIATAVPTLVRYGAEPSATAHYRGPADDETGPDRGVGSESVDLGEVSDLVVGKESTPDRRIESVEVTMPRKLLGSGLSLVDTPGVGGLASDHGAATLGALPAARAVLFVTDASAELSAPEIDFLVRAHTMCPHLAVVLTKIDLYPEWRTIAELDRGHLANKGLSDLPVLPVSSVLRLRAVADNDAAMNRESGYGALVAWLRESVMARADDLIADGAARDVLDVAAQLRAAFAAEREILADPAASEAVLAELRAAEERAAHLKSGSARWQTTLSDGVQDLNADLDHDLRERFRLLNRSLDERLDGVDPLDVWDELEPWYRHAVAEAVGANHRELLVRADRLSSEIAQLFAADAASLDVASSLASPLESVEGVVVATELDASTKPGVVANALSVLRGGYGGMMMFGMLAGMAGLALATPVTVGVGLLMGRKQQKDEKVRQVTQRRQQAKQVCRSYADAVNFEVSKQLRDQLRRVHRELRDGWAERAQELQASTIEALESAKRAAADQSGGQRLADVEAELQRLDGLAAQARTLLAEAAVREADAGGGA